MGKLIEPRILGFNPVDADTSALFVADKDNNEYKVFDSEGELYTPDGGVVSTRLDALEAGIPPIDDARIVVLEGAKAQNDLDVADLQGRMTTAESDIDAVEATVASEQLLLDQAQTDIVNLQGDMTTAQADIVTAKGVADATTIVANAHVARTDNPHAVTHTQVGADAAGTAATAVLNHVAAADPHAQYLKENATASEVEVLPLNDANNYFSTSTLGEQMQEAGAHMVSTANPHSVSFAQVTPNSTQVENLPLIDAGGYFGATPKLGNAMQQLGSDMTNVYEGNEGAAGQVLMSNGSGLASYENGDNIPMSDTGNYFAGNDKLGTQIQSIGASLAQKANVAQEDWIAPTLLNSWVNYSTATTCGYRKDNFGRVHLRGTLKSGTAPGILFILPVGYRPVKMCFYPIYADGAFGALYIDYAGAYTGTAGAVYRQGVTNTMVSLDGISFST